MSGRLRATGLLRRLTAVAMLTLVVAVIAYAIYRWRTSGQSSDSVQESTAPPKLSLEDVDAGVRQRIVAARDAVLQDPMSPDAWGTLGIMLLIHDFPVAAEECLTRAEQLDPEDIRWPYWRSMALLSSATPNPEGAIDSLKRSLELAEAERNKDATEIIRITLAGLYLETGRFDEASQLYEQLRRENPDHPRAALGLGQIAFLRAEWDKAEQLLEQCRSNPHTRKAAGSLLAQIYERTGRGSQAVEILKHLAEMPEDQPWPDPIAKAAFIRFQATRHVFVQHLRRLQKTGKQIDRDFLRQRAQESQYEELFWLDEGERSMRAGRLAEAERAFRNAVARDPSFIEARLRLAEVLFRLDKLAEAQTHLRRIVDEEPTYAPAWLLIAACHRKMANPDAELEALRRAVILAPMNRDGQLRYAELLFARGQAAGARKHAGYYLMLVPSATVAADVAGMVALASNPYGAISLTKQLTSDRSILAKMRRAIAIVGR